MRLKALIALSAIIALVAFGSPARADVIVSNNAAANGGGPITTINFTTKTPVGSFVPDGAFDGNNGRGLALTLNEFFYTELTSGFGPTDGIRIAPYNGGAGGADIGFFVNPIPGTGISDLAFGKEGLWVLAGYPGTGVVFLLNPSTGALIGGPINLQGLGSGTDGFTVLPDGTVGVPSGAKFLANTADLTNNYQYFDALGNPVGSPFSIPANALGTLCGQATGVDIAPDGLSLYFECNFNSIVQTDFAGHFIDSATIAGLGEDIAIQQPFTPPPPSVPEPATLVLLGLGALGLAAFRRRAVRDLD